MNHHNRFSEGNRQTGSYYQIYNIRYYALTKMYRPYSLMMNLPLCSVMATGCENSDLTQCAVPTTYKIKNNNKLNDRDSQSRLRRKVARVPIISTVIELLEKN